MRGHDVRAVALQEEGRRDVLHLDRHGGAGEAEVVGLESCLLPGYGAIIPVPAA